MKKEKKSSRQNIFEVDKKSSGIFEKRKFVPRITFADVGYTSKNMMMEKSTKEIILKI